MQYWNVRKKSGAHSLAIFAAIRYSFRFFIILILSALPIGLLLILLNTYAVDIPHWDQWSIIYLFEKYYNGDLTFNDFWHQHNEHRLIFPKLIFFGLGLLSKYNVLYEIATNVIMAFLMYLLIIWHINKNKYILGIEQSYQWLWIFMSCFVFCLSQFENWLWGFQLQWFLNTLSVVAGAFLISNYRITPLSFAGLCFCGIVSTFSLSAGILYWIVIAFFLVLRQVRVERKSNYFVPAAWILIFILVLTAYLYNYHHPPNHPSLWFAIQHPFRFLLFIAAYIGTPLSRVGDVVPDSFIFHLASFIGSPLTEMDDVQMAFQILRRGGMFSFSIIFGVAGLTFWLLYVIYYCVKKPPLELQRHFFFLVLGAYGVLSAALTAIGRLGLGVHQAGISRYASVAVLVWISVFFLIYATSIGDEFKSKLLRRIFCLCKIGLLVIIFVALNWASYKSIGRMQEVYVYRNSGRNAVLNGVCLECLSNLSSNPQRLIDFDIPRLKRLKLSVFRDPVPDVLEITIPQTYWHAKRGWSLNWIYEGIEPNKRSAYCFGSWSGSPANTGMIETLSMPIFAPITLFIPVIHGGDVKKQKIGIHIAGKNPVELLCDLDTWGYKWACCDFDLTPYTGRSFKLFAEDCGAEWGQWVGFAQPVLISQ